MKYDIAVIGGGAAGIVAAISASRKSAKVVVCERLPKLGKKILASGNGRCNLSNTNIDASHYNYEARRLAGSILSVFGKDDISDFFKELGLYVYSDEGRIFPVTNQSSSVMKVLENELNRLKVDIVPGFEVMDIKHDKAGYLLRSKDGKSVSVPRVIIASGGMSYPALGSNGSLYPICAKLGHTIKEPVPSVVPLVAKDQMCHLLQGQKVFAKVTAIVGGKEASNATGDLMFTKYGLSGTAIIDASEDISIAIHRQGQTDVFIEADMAPFISRDDLITELDKRLKSGMDGDGLVAGILPNKFGLAMADIMQSGKAADITRTIKARRFKIIGTRGWNEAEFTAGGVVVDEVNEVTLESKKAKGIYFAGEILDVNGKRGGYNLAWAWASGYVAGASAAKQAKICRGEVSSP